MGFLTGWQHALVLVLCAFLAVVVVYEATRRYGPPRNRRASRRRIENRHGRVRFTPKLMLRSFHR